MRLSEYIESIGVKAFAEKFGVTERAAIAYKQGTRRPRPKVAQRIVKNSDVTWEGIYAPRSASELRC